jgi:Flp pilus assembly protein TadG
MSKQEKAPAPARRPRLAIFKRFRRNDDGATAIEFGFVGLPFFALMFAIIETAMMFWSSQVLEEALASSARKILTGELQKQYPNPTIAGTKLKEEVCSRVVAIFDCNGAVKIDVQTFSSYGNAQATAVNAGVMDTSAFAFNPVGPNQITLVRAAMEYSLLFPTLNSSMANLSNGKRAIVASAAFRTEPYPIP